MLEAARAPLTADVGDPSGESHAVRNDHHREIASVLVRREASMHLPLLAIALGPSQSLLEQCMKLSRFRWEAEQRLAQAKSMVTGERLQRQFLVTLLQNT